MVSWETRCLGSSGCSTCSLPAICLGDQAFPRIQALHLCRQGARGHQLPPATSSMGPCPPPPADSIVGLATDASANLSTQGAGTTPHLLGHASHALTGIQPSLQQAPLIRTQLAVFVSHIPPPDRLDRRCCTSFLSAPFGASRSQVLPFL